MREWPESPRGRAARARAPARLPPRGPWRGPATTVSDRLGRTHDPRLVFHIRHCNVTHSARSVECNNTIFTNKSTRQQTLRGVVRNTVWSSMDISTSPLSLDCRLRDLFCSIVPPALCPVMLIHLIQYGCSADLCAAVHRLHICLRSFARKPCGKGERTGRDAVICSAIMDGMCCHEPSGAACNRIVAAS